MTRDDMAAAFVKKWIAQTSTSVDAIRRDLDALLAVERERAAAECDALVDEYEQTGERRGVDAVSEAADRIRGLK